MQFRESHATEKVDSGAERIADWQTVLKLRNAVLISGPAGYLGPICVATLN